MGTPSSKNKRSDLQGIRGAAIIAVLGFHFFPKQFPNGYLGVDQFFVLSGFLMCMLLRRCSNSSSGFSSLKLITEFYAKRLKRLLPLYFVFMFVSLISLIYIFPKTAYETNFESAKRALLFVSNRAATEAEDYFAMLSIAVDLFTHTWSLSVEVQFYLIVPLLFIFGLKMFPKRFQIHFYALIGEFFNLDIEKELFQEYFHMDIHMPSAPKSDAFNSVFARIWQFMIGMIVFMITETIQKEEISTERISLIGDSSIKDSEFRYKLHLKLLKYFLLISIITALSYSVEINSELLRPFFTVSTGILMILSRRDVILSFPILTYIGDISYSLYLIHWPFYAYWKLELSGGQTWNFSLLAAFSLSVLLAVISYEYFEKRYLQWTGKLVSTFCVVLIASNCLILHRDQIERYLIPQPPRNFDRLDGIVDGAIKPKKLNEEWSVNDYRDTYVPTCTYENGKGPFGRCEHNATGLNEKNGKYKILIIGNSLAANHARIIYQECGLKAKSMAQISIRGCEPLYPSSYDVQRCIDNVEMFKQIMPKENPDYAFLMSRFLDTGNPFQNGVTRLEDDLIYRGMKTVIDIFVKSVKKKLFVFVQTPEILPSNIEKIVENVKNGNDLVEFDKSFVLLNHTMARMRYERLISECDKCESIIYDSLFWNTTTKTWRFYDEKNSGLSYVTTAKHLSFHGLELVRPIFRDICNKV